MSFLMAMLNINDQKTVLGETKLPICESCICNSPPTKKYQTDP